MGRTCDVTTLHVELSLVRTLTARIILCLKLKNIISTWFPPSRSPFFLPRGNTREWGRGQAEQAKLGLSPIYVLNAVFVARVLTYRTCCVSLFSSKLILGWQLYFWYRSNLYCSEFTPPLSLTLPLNPCRDRRHVRTENNSKHVGCLLFEFFP